MPSAHPPLLVPAFALLFLAGCPGPEFVVDGGSQSTGSAGTTTTTETGTGGAGGSTGSGGGGAGGTACVTAADCGEVECQVASCADGACSWAPAGEGPAATQVDGDCQTRVCTPAGEVGQVAEPADLPGDDGDACTGEVCNGVTPEHPQLPANAPCGGGNICSPAGTCVECLEVAQCNPGPCQTPEACTAGVCEYNSEEPGTGCGTLDQCDSSGGCVDCIDDAGCGDVCPGGGCICVQNTCVTL